MLVVASALLSTALADPRPPAQTEWQKNKVADVAKKAPPYNQQGYNEVIEYINSPRFKLAVNGTPLATRSATDIAEWFMGNLQLAPLTHTFEVADLDVVRQLGYPPNIWEMMRLNKAKFSKVQDTAEVKLMGYPEFANKSMPTTEEAVNRPQYLSLNIWRGMNGQYFYGEVHLAFNPAFKDRLILAPVDTGGFTQDCIHVASDSDTRAPNCTVWQRDNEPWGVWKLMWHMVLRHCEYYNYKLSDLMLHMLGKEQPDTWYYRHYYEADVMGHFLLPEALLYIVGNHSQFANQVFHDFARQYTRPLMWAGEYNIMVADPLVGFINGEYQITQHDKDTFLPLWQKKAPYSWADILKVVVPDLQLRALRIDSCTTEKSMEYKGGDIGQFGASSTDECCRGCDHNAGCMAWTFDASKKLCFMKNGNVQRAKASDSLTSAVRSACVPVDGRNYIGQNKNHKCLYWQ